MNESEAMKNYALYYGNESIMEDIIIENESTTTCENAINVYKISKGYNSFVLCTSKFHVNRSAFTFDYVFRGIKAKFCTYGVSDNEVLTDIENPRKIIALKQKLLLLDVQEKEKYDNFIKNKKECLKQLQ